MFREIGKGSFLGVGVEPSPLVLRPIIGLLYRPWMIDDDDDDCGAVCGMNDWQGNQKYLEKPCQAAAVGSR
jgi:hypothetical protein